MNPVKISVVTAVYNSKDTITQALDSSFNQDYSSVERIVVDGGSNDGTLSILEKSRPRLDTIIIEPDEGIYDALNKGIRSSTGDVVGFLHADDLFAHKSVLSKIAAAFTNPEVDAVYGDLVYVSRSNTGKVIRYWRAGEYTKRKLLFGWMPPHPTLYVRNKIYERLGAFNTEFRIAADYESVLRFFGPGKLHAAYLPEVLVKMRVGGISNRTIANIVRKSLEDYRALRANDIGGIGTLALKNVIKVQQFFQRYDRNPP